MKRKGNFSSYSKPSEIRTPEIRISLKLEVIFVGQFEFLHVEQIQKLEFLGI